MSKFCWGYEFFVYIGWLVLFTVGYTFTDVVVVDVVDVAVDVVVIIPSPTHLKFTQFYPLLHVIVPHVIPSIKLLIGLNGLITLNN